MPCRVRVPVALTIAGSDSGGGAGIQADLKAFARCGVHGACAITAVTAQNTVGVVSVRLSTSESVTDQLQAVISDMQIDAVKIGMLGSAEIVHAVAGTLRGMRGRPFVVLDPVLNSSSGTSLLDEPGLEALVDELLPLTTVVTPNLAEASVLAAAHASAVPAREAAAARAGAGGNAEPTPGLETLARAIGRLGPQVVIVTGGHAVDRDGQPTATVTDLYVDGQRTVELDGERVRGGASHGSGCTHSAALAALLAHGLQPLAAAREARGIVGDAILHGLDRLGAGEGPVAALHPGLRLDRVPAGALGTTRPAGTGSLS